MRRLALALAVALPLVACGGEEEVHLTLRLDDSVTADRIPTIRALEIAVLGSEPADIRYGISDELNDREATWLYVSRTRAPLQFAVAARGDGRVLIASGRSRVITPGKSAVSDTIILGTTPPPPDKRRLGESCTPGVDTCASGFCADGVCCAVPCGGPCATCRGPVPGKCVLAAAGTNPRKACPSEAGNPCGMEGVCDDDGACRIAPKGKLCAQPSCAGGVFTSGATCDGRGACEAQVTRDCAPYACNPMGTACATICTAASGCAPSVTCTTGSCGKVKQGARCFGGADCQGELPCVDGYCCESSCTGACKSCKEPGHEGTCVDIPAGSDDPHKVCKDTGAAMCAQNGKCDGKGGCQQYPAGTQCGKASCSSDGGSYTAASICAGDGSPCPAPVTTDCAPYRCATDGVPGCGLSCGECAFYEPGMAPPFADRCAEGLSCVDQCLVPGGSFVCQ
jgi:hypothetical protein